MTAIVQLSRVHARDRAAGTALYEVTSMLEPGVHAFVGTAADGSALLCDVMAGRIRPRIGAVTIAGRDPAVSPALRRRIGALLAEPALPPLGTVEATARALGLDGALATLSALGAGSLAGRTVRSLHRDEARVVELAFALGLVDPVAVVLYEPFIAVDAEAVRRRIEELATSAAVIVATAEVGELEAMGPNVYVLDAGRLLTEALRWPQEMAPELDVWLASARDARLLAARLAGNDTVTALSLRHDRVRLAAGSLAAAARALATASDGLAVVSLRPRLPGHAALVVEARRSHAERLAARAAMTGLAPEGGS